VTTPSTVTVWPASGLLAPVPCTSAIEWVGSAATALVAPRPENSSVSALAEATAASRPLLVRSRAGAETGDSDMSVRLQSRAPRQRDAQTSLPLLGVKAKVVDATDIGQVLI